MAEIEFYGETFSVVETPNEFALMEFADAAEDVEANTMNALATVLRLLQETIAADPQQEAAAQRVDLAVSRGETPDVQDTILAARTAEREWQRFKLCARKNRANSETLMPVVFAVFEQATDRPTGQPAVSSGGQEITQLTSVSKPADPVMERLEGRPDMQAAVLQMRHSA